MFSTELFSSEFWSSPDRQLERDAYHIRPLYYCVCECVVGSKMEIIIIKINCYSPQVVE